jgi:6-phosphogluconolactonase (cycloisomerase 2 family)
VLAVNHGSGEVVVLPIHKNGAVEAPVSACKPGANAHMIMGAPLSEHYFVSCKGSGDIAQVTFDPVTATLRLKSTVAIGAGTGPRHLAFHPNQRRAYLINELSNTITVLRYIDKTGTLDLINQTQVRVVFLG